MTIRESKQALRKQMRLKRDNLDSSAKKQYDQWVCTRLLELIEFQKPQSVHTYLPMGSEINLHPLIQILLDRQIQVTCPQTLGNRQLKHLILHDLNEIESGKFGTQHPASKKIYTGPQDLIIVPGLAFDSKNYRLGYGGGYYDSFLDQQPTAYKIGLAYPFQMVAQVPKEAHDQQLDQVLFKEETNNLSRKPGKAD